MNLKTVSLSNIISIDGLFTTIINNWEKQINKKGATILAHVGVLKLLLSPTIRCNQILKSKGTIFDKLSEYTKAISSDAIDALTRTTVGIETIYENIIGDPISESKYSKSPQSIEESLTIVKSSIKKANLTKSLRIGLLGIQSTIDPKQAYRNKMRYGK